MNTQLYIGKFMPTELRESLLRFRHDIFVAKLGWNIPGAVEEMDIDEFDRDDTVYIIVKNTNHRIVGCARLLPTTAPYLLSKYFDRLLHAPAPVDERVWELSRFAASPAHDGPEAAQSIGRHLLLATLRYAADLGIERIVGVTFSSVERLFRQSGACVHAAGAAEYIDGRKVVACNMDVQRSLAGMIADRAVPTRMTHSQTGVATMGGEQRRVVVDRRDAGYFSKRRNNPTITLASSPSSSKNAWSVASTTCMARAATSRPVADTEMTLARVSSGCGARSK